MKPPTSKETQIETLGPCTLSSPLKHHDEKGFVDDTSRIMVCRTTDDFAAIPAGEEPPTFEWAGPREKIYFNPSESTCGIVTCGGLCPGLNNVIRAITLTAYHVYGVPRILGFRYGYEGISSNATQPPRELTPTNVEYIHQQGGTYLGSSRGPQDEGDMVDTLKKYGVNMLFVIGGDGTLRGGRDLVEEINQRGENISVIGVPKTIDNDLEWMQRSFGFTTAVEEARSVIACAHTEAKGALNGIGLVKLMGRHSGFIAAHATLASHDVNFCLVPEVPFKLEGPGGFLEALKERLVERHHAVVVVAEGTGQDLLEADPSQRDASGNVKLKDIGIYMQERISDYLTGQGVEHAMKYIDPSYTIRGLPASGVDAEFCLVLGQGAVHAAMTGRTNMVVGFWNGLFCHVPISLVTQQRNRIDPDGPSWRRVLASTGQGALDGI